MSQTPSNMLALGTSLPVFNLVNTVNGDHIRSDELPGSPATLVMFICNHCPYVVHIRSALVKLAHAAQERGAVVLAINSNSARSHPQDGPEHMKALALSEQWKFPFLFDETQTVAKAFEAACTPDFFLFDKEKRLAYRGRFDGATPGRAQVPVTGEELQAALDAVLAGKAPSHEQKASIGCNIKWA